VQKIWYNRVKLPEQNDTVAYTTRKTVNRLAREQLHLNNVPFHSVVFFFLLSSPMTNCLDSRFAA
jgi:hypothetical protein